MVNPGNVAGGHKANLNNPNSSEESKQHSKQVLESEDFESASDRQEDKNPNNVAGGLKATLKNPNVSDEAKNDAKQRLEQMED